MKKNVRVFFPFLSVVGGVFGILLQFGACCGNADEISILDIFSMLRYFFLLSTALIETIPEVDGKQNVRQMKLGQ